MTRYQIFNLSKTCLKGKIPKNVLCSKCEDRRILVEKDTTETEYLCEDCKGKE